MKKFTFQLIALLIVIFGALYFGMKTQFSPTFTPNQPISGIKSLQIIDASSTQETVLVKVKMNVEIANTKEKRSKGLGGRESLASDSGMLFIFEKSDKYQFWMKGLRFPLDFIWISGDRVVDILKNIAPPEKDQPDESLPRYAPVVTVDKVLEVNAGFVDTYNIRVGDKIILLEKTE